MSPPKIRRQIACETAWLIHSQVESDLSVARHRAAHRLTAGNYDDRDLPSDREVRDELQALARMHNSPLVRERLTQLRSAAKQLLTTLARFTPRLTGEVLEGTVSEQPTIEIELLAEGPLHVIRALALEGTQYRFEKVPLREMPTEGYAERLVVPSVRDVLHCKTDLADYELDELADVPLVITMKLGATQRDHNEAKAGDDPRRATRGELEELVAREYRGVRQPPNLESQPLERFVLYRSLLLPLENVQQPPRLHPEGDALYHSLQVFQLVREQASYDEELQLAALLHDVGKAIDAVDPRGAALAALAGQITERTHWLIEHLSEAEMVLSGEIGMRAHRRLKESEDYDDLMLLARANRAGRKSGVEVCDLDEALVFIQLLAADNEAEDEEADDDEFEDDDALGFAEDIDESASDEFSPDDDAAGEEDADDSDDAWSR